MSENVDTDLMRTMARDGDGANQTLRRVLLDTAADEIDRLRAETHTLEGELFAARRTLRDLCDRFRLVPFGDLEVGDPMRHPPGSTVWVKVDDETVRCSTRGREDVHVLVQPDELVERVR